MSIANLRSGDVFTAQFNPSELTRTVSVNYTRLGILGQSHQQLQFQWRENEKLDFTLYFDKRSTDAGDAVTAQGLLDATTVGSRGAQDIAGGGPPDVLFEWPEFLLLRCRVTTLKYSYKHFAPNGEPIHFQVAVTVEEARDERLVAEDVLTYGLRRE